MSYGDQHDTDDYEREAEFYDPDLDVTPDGYWTFEGNRDEMLDAAEKHHPELADSEVDL